MRRGTRRRNSASRCGASSMARVCARWRISRRPCRSRKVCGERWSGSVHDHDPQPPPHQPRRRLLHPSEVARLACEIEIERLREPVGKQDQYIAAYGGITCFDFHPDGTVEARPLAISMDTLFDLEDNLLLFFTGFARSAGE